MVMCDTVQKSGADSSIIRIHGKKKAIAVAVDSSAIYCKSHPFSGGKQIVCENWRNLISVGAMPIAITNCLNFGNPEDPKIMGEFAECIKGIKSACEFLNYPVVSGNVSFYNGTNNKNIYPTPVIGGVGLINELKDPVKNNFQKEGSLILSIGKNFGHLTQSALFLEVFNYDDGPPPEANLLNERNNGENILKLIENNFINSIHDISSGGLIVTLAEMSINSSLGVKIKKPKSLSNLFEFFFSEDQGRYCIEIDKEKYDNVKKILQENNIFHEIIGVVQRDDFELEKEFKISINDLYKINNKWYYNY